MDKQKVTSNDVLEALSIRINETIRPNRNKDKKNNAYFWIFKFILLLLYIQLIVWAFNEVRGIGVLSIYAVANSLRSVLSSFWIIAIEFMKGLIVLYLLFYQFKIFTESPYFKELYKDEKKLLKKKKSIKKIIEKIFKVFAVIYLLIIGFVAALSLFAFVYMISMFSDGIFLVSPLLIMALVFVICMLIFRHIQNKFFGTLPVINRNYILIMGCALIVSIGLFGYEVSSFERDNGLPKGFELTNKTHDFILQDGQNVLIHSDSKLDNLTLVEDNSLTNEIKVEVQYYKTAKVWYVSEFNDFDDLKLVFTSDIDYGKVEINDLLKLFVSTFNGKTIYNYNLFKYPNIYIYANKADFNRITIK